MSAAADRQRFARIALSFVTEPGEPALGALLRACGPAEAFAAVMYQDDPAIGIHADHRIRSRVQERDGPAIVG